MIVIQEDIHKSLQGIVYYQVVKYFTQFSICHPEVF